MSPKISICVPTYNGEEYLQEALDSISIQTYKDFEVVISDDGSQDNTLGLVNKFKNAVDFPVTFISHQPSGIGANWNNCIKHAKGTYIKFLFQDDVLYPGCIEEMVSVFELHPQVGLVASKRDFIVEGTPDAELKKWIETYGNLQTQFENNGDVFILDKEIMRRKDFLMSPPNKIGEPSTVLFKKSILKEVGLFDERLQQILDYVFYYRILKKKSIVVIKKPLVGFRLHKEQATQINKERDIPDYELYDKILYTEFRKFMHPEVRLRLLKRYNRSYRMYYRVRNKLKRIKKRLLDG